MMYSTREISLDAMRKSAGNKGRHTEGQHMETSGSAWECDWVVGSQILTRPFHSKEDFEFMELVQTIALTKDQVDHLVKLIKKCKRSPGSLTFEGAQDVEHSWEDTSRLLTPVRALHTMDTHS